MTAMDALQKYRHSQKTIDLGGTTLELLIPDDPDKIFFEMTEEEFGLEEKLPHWARLWPGAVALGMFMVKNPPVAGSKVLDLGCGLALNGILAAKFGAEVLASDWFEEAVQFALASAELNRVQLKTACLDWNNPAAELRFDIVLGADLLYEARNHRPILEFLEVVLNPGGVALLSDHGRPHLPAFRTLLCRSTWVHEETMEGTVHIFRLSRQAKA